MEKDKIKSFEPGNQTKVKKGKQIKTFEIKSFQVDVQIGHLKLKR